MYYIILYYIILYYIILYYIILYYIILYICTYIYIYICIYIYMIRRYQNCLVHKKKLVDNDTNSSLWVKMVKHGPSMGV